MCGAVEQTLEGLGRGTSGGGNSLAQSILDLGIQGTTGGLATYRKDEGGVKVNPKGSLTLGTMGIDLYKDLTGVTTKEKAIEDAKKAAEEANAQALQERENIKAQNAADQLAASRQASSVRSTSTSRGKSTGGVNRSTINSLGGGQRDFLGL